MPTTTSPRPAVVPAAYKLREACQYLGGLSERTLRDLAKRGELKPLPNFRHLVFSKKNLDAFLAKN